MARRRIKYWVFKKRLPFSVWVIIGFLCTIALFGTWFQLAYDVEALQTHYPVVSWNNKDAKVDVVFAKDKPNNWADLDEISQFAIGAVIVSEDWKFFDHRGLDLKEFFDAVKLNYRQKRFVRGASTISQQVAKNVFLSHEKTLWRKFKELLITLRLERELSKLDILEIYLNIAQWGKDLYGIKAAARYYFEKHPSLLTAHEAAFLAMLLPSPERYSESYRRQALTPFARRSIERILRKMVQAGYIQRPDEYNESADTSEPTSQLFRF